MTITDVQGIAERMRLRVDHIGGYSRADLGPAGVTKRDQTANAVCDRIAEYAHKTSAAFA